MPANTAAIYSKSGNIGFGKLTTANTAKDGTGTVVTIFTADATNGSRVEQVRVKALGTNVATVLRIFINNGSDPTVATNNTLHCEATIAATTLTEVAALPVTTFPNNATVIDPTAFPIVLPAGYKLTATIGTTISAGIQVNAFGGNY